MELLDRDDVAIYNSIPTAEGAIMMAIQDTDFTIHGSMYGAWGSGEQDLQWPKSSRIGSKSTVGVRSEEHFARASEMGWSPFMTTDLAAQTGEVDLLFNTIPTMIITAQILSKCRKMRSLSTLHPLLADVISGLPTNAVLKRYLLQAYPVLSLPKRLADYCRRVDPFAFGRT